MNKNFKASKKGKYIQIEYLGYEPANHYIDLHTHGHMWHSKASESRDFMKKILELEVEFQKELDRRELSHNPKKIIRFYLNVIDGISSGFDVRSSMSNEEIAKAFVNGFDTVYNEGKSKCEAIIIKAKVSIAVYIFSSFLIKIIMSFLFLCVLF